MPATNEIEEKHRAKVIIFNGFNGSHIEQLKEIPEAELDKQKKFYDEYSNFLYYSGGALKEKVYWRKSFVTCYLLISLLMIFLSSGWDELRYLGLALALFSYTLLIEKGGHKSGYFDGYENGFVAGINKALAIDDEDKKLIQDTIRQQKDDEIESRVISNLVDIMEKKK